MWNNSFLVVAEGSCECATVEPWTEQRAEIWRVKQAVKQTRYLEKLFYNTLKATNSQLVVGSDSNQENILVTTKHMCVCVCKQCKYNVH